MGPAKCCEDRVFWSIDEVELMGAYVMRLVADHHDTPASFCAAPPRRLAWAWMALRTRHILEGVATAAPSIRMNHVHVSLVYPAGDGGAHLNSCSSSLEFSRVALSRSPGSVKIHVSTLSSYSIIQLDALVPVGIGSSAHVTRTTPVSERASDYRPRRSRWQAGGWTNFALVL